MTSRRLLLSRIPLCLLLLFTASNVYSAPSNSAARVVFAGRKPVLLSNKVAVPVGAVTKGRRPQNRVELPALSPSELQYIQQQQKTDGQKRLRIGIGRALSQSISIDPVSAPVGLWTTATNGAHIWTVHLTSHGAIGLRVHLETLTLDPRVNIVTYNPFSPDASIAPVACEQPDPEVGVWTPTVLGEDAVVECQVPAEMDISSVRFRVTGVSHQYTGTKAAPAALPGSCEHDIKCQPNWISTASGVARIDFVDRAGDGFACSGCLIANRNSARTANYFLTAHHCIGNSGLASTIESTWFWYDTQCDNPNTDNGGTMVGGGADLLATSASSDFALIRLREDPPGGALPQDWTTNLLAQGADVTGIHYPYPDPEKISFGNEIDENNGFWYLQWSYGITEEGSSGSPLFNAQHQIAGQLWGGSSACDNPQGPDKYGRFDKTFPHVRKWIDSFPFVLVQGSYSGLFSDSADPANQSSGFFSLTLRDQGAYSGTMLVAGKRHSFSGAFDQSGAGSNQIPAGPGTNLTLNMALNVTAGAESITGQVSNGDWTADLLAKRAAFNSRTNPAPFAPQYTLVFPGGDSSDVPRGYGFASVAIDQSGHARISGALGDGTSFSQSTVLFPDNTLPLYANLYSGHGVVNGWLSFSGGSPPPTIGGSTSWLKDSVPRSKLYPQGFALMPSVHGELYVRPTDSTIQVVAISTGTISFSGGNLASDFSNDITISGNNRVTDDSANRLSMSFSPSTGHFNGTVTPPLGGRGIPFHGIVLQRSTLGYGYFLGSTESGSVQLSPR